MITDKYLRKLVWGIGFALFCALLAGLYSFLFRKKNKVTVCLDGIEREVFSFSDVIVFAIMTFLASVRLNTGSDFYNYYIQFNRIRPDIPLTQSTVADWRGINWLGYLIKQFTDYEYAIFVVTSVILYLFLFWLLRKEVRDRPAAFVCYLFLGFFANSLNILKQCFAMMFVMCFYRSLRDKRLLGAVIFGFLAFLFHYSALFAVILIGVLTVIRLKPSGKLLLISILVGVVSMVLLPSIIAFIAETIPSAAGYKVYADWRRSDQIRLIIAVAGMSLIYAVLVIYLVRNRELLRAQSEKRYLELSFLIIGLCINIASVRIWVVNRFALYFYQFIILILPTLFQGMPPERRRKHKIILYSLMFVYLIFSGIFLGENEYYSYNTVFSGESPIYDAVFNRQFD